MKQHPLKIGGRIWKTVIAVFLCFLIDWIKGTGTPFYSEIAAIICLQQNYQDSLSVAKTREIATILGGVFGLGFLLFEQNIWHIAHPMLRYSIISILLIPIIKTSNLLKQDKGTYLMIVVFLSITITHGGDASPVLFALSRVIDTTIGIVVALLINLLPWSKRPGNVPKDPIPPPEEERKA